MDARADNSSCSLQSGQQIRQIQQGQTGGNPQVGGQLAPILRSEQRKPIELQLFPGRDLCLRDAIALDLACRPSLEALLESLEGHIKSGILPPLTVLAMVLSALHANCARGRVYYPVVWEKLLSHVVQKTMPEHFRLEALLVFRGLQGGKADEATVLACEQSFAKSYANLAAQAKAARLEKWAGMEWWNPAICNFAGHTGPGPMKRMAVQGLLDMLGPRLRGKGVGSQTRCLSLLLEHIYPEQDEIPREGPLDLQPWKPCLEAWAALASKLEPKDLATMMFELLIPVLPQTPEVWPHQAEILLGALAQSLGLLNQQAQQQALGAMSNFFIWLSPRTFAIHHSNARLAVSLSMKMLKLLQGVTVEWAKIISNDLRRVINADPQNSPFKPTGDTSRLELDCSPQ